MARTKPFDEHYEKYEEWFPKNRSVYQSELKAIGHFIPQRGKGVEIGIGSGKFAVPFGIKVGVEPSKAMRKLAREKRIRVYNAVAESLPFGAGQFDFALMVTTICFVDDIKKSFQEVERILINGGYFIIGFVDRASSLGRRYEKEKEANVFYREATFFSTEEVLSLLSECGFEEPEVIQTVFGELAEIRSIQDYKEGYGEGGFVVIQARKAS
jgi:SAM-dependent methyltransferase